jgi:N-succinyldiaminopimelate aminotransferase
MPELANRVRGFGTTIFTTINALAAKHNAINLGQGAPNFNGPQSMLDTAADTLRAGTHNQYAPGWGSPALREAVITHAKRFYNLDYDLNDGVVITNGATEGIFDSLYGSIDPGDEVIVIEPYFDIYVPIIQTAGAVPVYVPLQPPGWTLPADALRAAFSDRTRAILINTPNNPTGHVFSRDELALIAELCIQHDAICITDEVYEHLVYDDARHIPIAALPGMFERTLTISSVAKSFSATGWKIGWVAGHPHLMQGVWRAHQLVSFAIFHPGQIGAAHALHLPDDYFAGLLADYAGKREMLMQGLDAAGLRYHTPPGAFYIMADFSGVFDGSSDVFTERLIQEVGVACIPPGSFYSDDHRHLSAHYVRFAFCKTDDMLEAACERLATLPQNF